MDRENEQLLLVGHVSLTYNLFRTRLPFLCLDFKNVPAWHSLSIANIIGSLPRQGTGLLTKCQSQASLLTKVDPISPTCLLKCQLGSMSGLAGSCVDSSIVVIGACLANILVLIISLQYLVNINSFRALHWKLDRCHPSSILLVQRWILGRLLLCFLLWSSDGSSVHAFIMACHQ